MVDVFCVANAAERFRLSECCKERSMNRRESYGSTNGDAHHGGLRSNGRHRSAMWQQEILMEMLSGVPGVAYGGYGKTVSANHMQQLGMRKSHGVALGLRCVGALVAAT